jgi:trypsin
MARLGKSAVLVAIALSVVVCTAGGAVAQPTTNVVGGTEAAPGSFPFAAWIYYHDESDNRVCTGTVVASNVILTAAHCVMRPNSGPVLSPAGFKVVTGSLHYLDPARTVSDVAGLAVSPTFRTEPGRPAPLEGDAAILILAQPTSAPPVRLAAARVWSLGMPVEYAGWGETHTPNPGDGLRVGQTSIREAVADCGVYLSASLICTRDVPQFRDSPCYGDSGGPLLMTAPGTASEPLQIGISAALGSGTCSPEAAAYFTRVDTVASWVAAMIVANPPAPVPPPSQPSPPHPSPPPPPPAPPAHATHREVRPRISADQARTKANAALLDRFGALLAARRGYKMVCHEINTHKQECRVHWQTTGGHYRGTVTVFGVIVAGKVVWKTPYEITATTCVTTKAADGHPACRVRTLRG